MQITITTRVRKRTLTSGKRIRQKRYVLNFKSDTGKRQQLFFATMEEAQAERNRLLLAHASGAKTPRQTDLTVADAIDSWLEARKCSTKPATLREYKVVTLRHVVRKIGHVKISNLAPSDIRRWHSGLYEASPYMAGKAKKFLHGALILLAEDGVPVPKMPMRLGRARPKAEKSILTPPEVEQIIAAAQADIRLIYVAFPFLAGTRPAEQLGLLWSEVDFNVATINICRVLERDGSLTEETKTDNSLRAVPIGEVLHKLLLAWQPICPSKRFVFPSPTGRPYTYDRWRRRTWVPGLAKAGVRYVNPHSARATFVSTLHASGIEVALAAKLAGHAPAVSLGYYTKPIRDGRQAVAALERAYRAGAQPPFPAAAEGSSRM
jgi:integrase